MEWIRGPFLVSPSASVVHLLMTIPCQVALFQLKCKVRVKSQYSQYTWYYKTREGSLATCSAAFFSLIQAGKCTSRR